MGVLYIGFGALAEPIIEQLRRQGFVAHYGVQADTWQKDADAITRLAVRGLISETTASSARRRLTKTISAGVTEVGG